MFRPGKGHGDTLYVDTGYVSVQPQDDFKPHVSMITSSRLVMSCTVMRIWSWRANEMTQDAPFFIFTNVSKSDSPLEAVV